MDKEKEFPARKNLRIKQYDYNSAGAYFVTICVKGRRKILSDIIPPQGMNPVKIRLTEIGKSAEKNLLASENIPRVKIDRYVIMPDHIHAIIILLPEKSEIGADVRPKTAANELLPRVISAFKRYCAKEIGEDIFQRGYIEHILRSKDDYLTRAVYIAENPARRFYKENPQY